MAGKWPNVERSGNVWIVNIRPKTKPVCGNMWKPDMSHPADTIVVFASSSVHPRMLCIATRVDITKLFLNNKVF